jgi:hypothetical protein
MQMPSRPARKLLAFPNPRDPFRTAPACAAQPTNSSSVSDDAGRLWGWENRSCAHKDLANAPVFYAGYEPGNYLQTKACEEEPFSIQSTMVRLQAKITIQRLVSVI